MRWLLILGLLARAAAAEPQAPPPKVTRPTVSETGVCLVVPPLLPASPPTIAAPPCHRPSAAVAAKIKAAIEKRYTPQYERGKPEVTLGCDGLGPQIREIVLEAGEGHGGGLTLWRARRGTGASYDVHGIRFANRATPPRRPPLELAAGRVELPELEIARGALAATVREAAQPAPGDLGGTVITSRDFHVLVRLTDDNGRVLERTFTGYAGTTDQDRYIGLELALEALGGITAVAERGGPATEEDRRLFAERFAAAVPRFDDPLSWWVTERYIELARYVGSPPTLAGLLTRLPVTKPDRSKQDARANAIAAIAGITGWDARTSPSLEDAATRYLAACKPQ
ncbi:MAG TPA: hypothetical protein VNO30_21160 [Kofleriaceae bacterium]|nr:hypothetical protein [Kofleriaceae bacterium]